jgi:hypothetical protein
MTAVFTISASGEHLDASTLALLAEVELDEMSIRALSEDLAADTQSAAPFDSPSDPANPSADEPATVYPWTTNGLLEAAKHLSTCNQCTTDRTALAASFNTAWQEAGTSGFDIDQALVDRHIATALAAFDETITPAVVPAAAAAKEKESTSFLGASGKQKSRSQDSGSSGWRTSGFGRAIGLRRNQVLIGFATLAIAVPLLLQLRPAKQFGGARMKAADTTASTSETLAAAAEFTEETQALAAETSAAMAAETMAAAAAVERSNIPLDTLSRVPAANLDQIVEPASAAEVGDDKRLAAGAPPDQSAEAVAETEAAAAAIDVETDSVLGASMSAAPAEDRIPPSTRPLAPSVKAPVPPTTPTKPISPAVSPAPPNDAAAKTRAKDATQGAVGGAGSATVPSPVPAPVPAPTPESTPTPTRTQAPKPAAKAKKTPAKSAAPVAPSPSPAAAAASAATAASTPQLAIPVVDPSVLNLGNVGPEVDPAALISRFRTAYDRVRPPTTNAPPSTTIAPAAPAVAPAPAAPASATSAASVIVPAPAVAPAPAAAVSADPVFAETGTPTTLASQSVERCVTNLFGATDRQIIAAASAILGNRPVWVVRVQFSTETVDVIINMSTCALLLRQPS